MPINRGTAALKLYRPAVAASGTPFSITLASTNSNAAATSPVTFTAQGIGTADPTRIVVVAISQGPTSTTAVSAVTIGGNSATHALNSDGGGSATRTDFWYLAVPTGTTANIVITAALQTRFVIGVYSVVGTSSSFSVATATSTGSGVATLSAPAITVPAGGGAIVIASVHNATVTITPSNYTQDGASVVAGTSTTSFGHDTSHSGSTTYGASWVTLIDASISVAAFNP